MSESQKRMAKRLVEVLIETGIMRKDFHGQYHDQIFIIGLHSKEQVIHEVALAIATYEAEEIEKAMALVRQKSKCSQCGRCK